MACLFDKLGFHYDPMNHDNPFQLSHGHCWVALAALARQAGQQAVTLFVSCALYVPKAACGAGQTYRGKLALAAELMKQAPENLLLVAVADGAYAKAPFAQALQASGRFLLSRLRRDAVFCDLPPARKPGQKGAPPQVRPFDVSSPQRNGLHAPGAFMPGGAPAGPYAAAGQSAAQTSAQSAASGRSSSRSAVAARRSPLQAA